jgi:hypothetical protein
MIHFCFASPEEHHHADRRVYPAQNQNEKKIEDNKSQQYPESTCRQTSNPAFIFFRETLFFGR